LNNDPNGNSIITDALLHHFYAALAPVCVSAKADSASGNPCIAMNRRGGLTVSARKDTGPQERPFPARRVLLTGGAVGLAAAAGSVLGRAQPALAQTATPDWINVTDYATIAKAVAAIPTTGGVLYFPAGSYTIANTITLTVGNGQGPIFVIGDGRDVSILNYTGTGACIHMLNAEFPGHGFPGINTWGGGVLGLTIDGSGTTGQSSGLHIGDGEEYVLDLKVRNFEQPGSFGLHIDNTVWWVGRMHAKAQLLNCDTAVAFDVNNSTSGGSVNFGYSEWDFDIFAYTDSPNLGRQQNGVTIQAGAHPYNSSLKIKGEWEWSAVNNSGNPSGTFLTVTGAYNNSSPASQLTDCELDIWTEMNGTGGGMTPQTVLLGSSSNKIKGCFGKMVFIENPAWQPAGGFTLGKDQFSFAGEVLGDTSLAPASGTGSTSPLQLAGAPVLYGPGFIDGTSGTLYAGNGDFFQATLGGSSATVTLSWGGQTPQAGPQRKTIILSQPSTGTNTNYAVGWPKVTTGSPTPSNPTVLWASGKTPGMSAGPGATDVYFLETYDGATWYGRASQNVS
jgi:hypothetical protein